METWMKLVKNYKFPVRRWISVEDVQQDDYSKHCWKIYLKVSERVDLESSHQKREKILLFLVSVYDDKKNFFVIIL